MNNRVIIDTYNLKTYALPPTDKAIENLQLAFEIADNLDIPGGFSYKTYLTSLPANINSNNNDIRLVRNFVATSITNYNNIVTTALDNLKIIQIPEIKKRELIIK